MTIYKILAEAMRAFVEHETLFLSTKEMIDELPKGILELQDLNRSAAIYLNEETTAAIDTYVATTRFVFATDGIGGIVYKTYASDFFKNLLDPDRSAQRTRAYKSAMKGLRKAVR